MTEIYKDKMKTLQYVFLLSSLFAFQALLFVSTATEARCLLLQTMSLGEFFTYISYIFVRSTLPPIQNKILLRFFRRTY